MSKNPPKISYKKLEHFSTLGSDKSLFTLGTPVVDFLCNSLRGHETDICLLSKFTLNK